MSNKKTYTNRDPRERERMKRYEYRSREHTTGKSVSHITVVPRRNERIERVIKRFLKKCKKEKIVEKVRNNTYYEKPSEKRVRKKARREKLLDKLRAEQKDK